MLHGPSQIAICAALVASLFVTAPAAADVDPAYELVLIHHSSGRNWILDHLGQAMAGLDWVELHSAGFREPYQMDDIAALTEVCHWLGKFSDSLDQVLTFDHSNNVYYADDRQNDIIVFKSCFPASDVTAVGTPPGDPNDCTQTVWNYRAAFLSLAPIFAQHPEKLFIPLTTIPRSYWDPTTDPAADMELTRQFNEWLKNDYVLWYRNTYGLANLAVFDAFDVLAYGPAGPLPDYLRAEFIEQGWGGADSHFDADGSQALTLGYADPDDGRQIGGFLPFLAVAVEAWKNPSASGTLGVELGCTPAWGTVPFTATLRAQLSNLAPDQPRRIVGRVHVLLASGSLIGNWRSGYTNMAPGEQRIISWKQFIPASGDLVGENYFQLVGLDVTPSPFNQPPYLPAGDTDSAFCVVTGVAP